MPIQSTSLYAKRRDISQKYYRTFITLLALLARVVAIALGMRMFVIARSLNTQAQELSIVQNHDLRAYKQDEYIKNSLITWQTIDDILQEKEQTKEEEDRFVQYQELLQMPYGYFMQYRLLPTLNIWKNPYTQTVDTSLIAQRFLEENPYTDLAIIDQRATFFESTGELGSQVVDPGQTNDVKDITIGTIKEFENGYFAIPLSLRFHANNRRSFLLLMEKLAMTSHHENITLINEFFFAVREQIRNEYGPELLEHANELANESMQNQDEITKQANALGYLMTQWLHQDRDFIEEFRSQRKKNQESGPSMHVLIRNAIRDVAGCNTQSEQECSFLFREKFRTLPYLIYPITNERKDTSKVLKQFLQAIPPVINIVEFTFDKIPGTRVGQESSYQGRITIEIFGRGIAEKEQQEIAEELGKQCLGEGQVLSLQTAQKAIEQSIVQISKIDALDTTRAQQLLEMQQLLEAIQQAYEDKSPYNKVIKLFEIYRMLKEGNICTA